MAERILLTFTEKELPFNLTPRQKQILPLMASGLSHETIAALLGISKRTISNIICGAKNPDRAPEASNSKIGIFGVVQKTTGKRPTQHRLAMDLLKRGLLK